MRAVDHPVAAEEVMAYLDGELDGPRSQAVQTHLATCAACQDVASRLRSLSTELSEWQVGDALALPAPPGSPAGASRRKTRWRMPQVWRLAGTAALTVVTAVVTVTTVLWLAPADSRRARVIDLPSTQELPAAALPPNPGAEPARASPAEPLRSGQAAQRPRQIVRTATLSLLVTDFTAVRPAIDRALRDVGGFLGHVQVNDGEAGQRMTAVLRVPASRLEEVIRALRGLGHVASETQSGEDVGEEVTDLDARLANARNTEARLGDVLRYRTGNVSQILEVEREIARVRGEIERMLARRQELEGRIVYATLTVHVSAERPALSTGRAPVAVRLRHAFVDGLRLAYGSAMNAAAFFLQVAPAALLWTAILWFPVRALLRARRARRP